MDPKHTDEMLKHIKVYIFVFISLAVLTLLTVTASHLQLSHTMHIVVAMAIATLKATLVGLFFMHLIHEKKMIYGLLFFTGIAFLVLIFVTFFTDMNMLRSTLFH